MIPGTQSTSYTHTKLVKENLSRLDVDVLYTKPDWYVSVGQLERIEPNNFIDVCLMSEPDWFVSVSPTKIVWANYPFQMRDAILLTNPDWYVETNNAEQTTGNNYTEQVIATGAVWFLHMDQPFGHMDDYVSSVKAIGPVWFLHMDHQYQNSDLFRYEDQIRNTGAVWYLSMRHQIEC